ncbi:MAG TPA: glycosyltransferase family 9 protein [Chthoniobacteraceae bacterium]
MKAPRDILVIKPSSLGDVVHTLPAVALLKRHWPESRIRWLINPEWAPLLAENPSVDEVLLFPRGEFRGLAGWMRIPAWAKRIAASRAELVLDFQGLLRSAVIGRLCRGKLLHGLSDAREGAWLLYDHLASVRGFRHAVDRYLRIPFELGIAPRPLEWSLPPGNAPAMLPSSPYILLHPFSRGAGKSLSLEQTTAFCRAVFPSRVVLVGRSEVEFPAERNVTDLLNRTTLLELIWLLRKASFVVSVDSGPMHIAAALGTRLVSIHTWSDPAKVGPYRDDAWIWKDHLLTKMRDLDGVAPKRACADVLALASFVSEQLQTR